MQSTPKAAETKKLQTHENPSILILNFTIREMGSFSRDAVQHITSEYSDPFKSPWLSNLAQTVAEIRDLADPESTRARIWLGNWSWRKGHTEAGTRALTWRQRTGEDNRFTFPGWLRFLDAKALDFPPFRGRTD